MVEAGFLACFRVELFPFFSFLKAFALQALPWVQEGRNEADGGRCWGSVKADGAATSKGLRMVDPVCRADKLGLGCSAIRQEVRCEVQVYLLWCGRWSCWWLVINTYLLKPVYVERAGLHPSPRLLALGTGLTIRMNSVGLGLPM